MRHAYDLGDHRLSSASITNPFICLNTATICATHATVWGRAKSAGTFLPDFDCTYTLFSCTDFLSHIDLAVILLLRYGYPFQRRTFRGLFTTRWAGSWGLFARAVMGNSVCLGQRVDRPQSRVWGRHTMLVHQSFKLSLMNLTSVLWQKMKRRGFGHERQG